MIEYEQDMILLNLLMIKHLLLNILVSKVPI